MRDIINRIKLFEIDKTDKLAELLKNIFIYLKMVKKVQSQCKWYSVCPMKWYFEEGKLDKKWIELYCKGEWQKCERYKLEEMRKPHPDWMLPDVTIDKSLKCVYV